MSRNIKPSLGELIDGRYRQHPRYRGCIGHWLFNEGGGGNVYSLANNADAGAITGGTWTIGPFGRALDLSGTTQYVTIQDRAGLRPGSGSWSMSAWIKGRTFAVGDWDFVISKQGGPTTYPGYALGILDGKFSATLTQSSGVIDRFSGAIGSLSTGTVYLLTAVADKAADQVILYINGALISYTTSNHSTWPTVSNTDVLTFGNYLTANYFDGHISDIRIYDRAVTPGEVRSLYENPFLEFEEFADRTAFEFDFAGQLRRSSSSRILQPYNLCEPFPGAP